MRCHLKIVVVVLAAWLGAAGPGAADLLAPIKVVSFNKKGHNTNQALERLTAIDADVIGLQQETYSEALRAHIRSYWADFTEVHFDNFGFGNRGLGEAPMFYRTSRFTKLAQGYFNGGLYGCWRNGINYATGGRNQNWVALQEMGGDVLIFVNVHFVSGAPTTRKKEARALTCGLANLLDNQYPGATAIVMGDLNSRWGSQYPSGAGGAVYEYFAQSGLGIWDDSIANTYGETFHHNNITPLEITNQLVVPTHPVGGDPGIQIDYVMANPSLEVLWAESDEAGPYSCFSTLPLGAISDHCPVWAVLHTSASIDDPDGDALESVADNCDDSYNPEQWDDDGDGYGDECDDMDGTDWVTVADLNAWQAVCNPLIGTTFRYRDKDTDPASFNDDLITCNFDVLRTDEHGSRFDQQVIDQADFDALIARHGTHNG